MRRLALSQASFLGLRPRKTGGERGIRTLGRGVTPTHAFQACRLNHSRISPRRQLERVRLPVEPHSRHPPLITRSLRPGRGRTALRDRTSLDPRRARPPWAVNPTHYSQPRTDRGPFDRDADGQPSGTVRLLTHAVHAHLGRSIPRTIPGLVHIEVPSTGTQTDSTQGPVQGILPWAVVLYAHLGAPIPTRAWRRRRRGFETERSEGPNPTLSPCSSGPAAQRAWRRGWDSNPR